ncbi:unnamed protein product, partial [Choristocarpus tenellus]
MVEILADSRGDCEWSPDMELDSCDAEKAAALLLSVAPRCRSQSLENNTISPVQIPIPVFTTNSSSSAPLQNDQEGNDGNGKNVAIAPVAAVLPSTPDTAMAEASAIPDGASVVTASPLGVKEEHPPMPLSSTSPTPTLTPPPTPQWPLSAAENVVSSLPVPSSDWNAPAQGDEDTVDGE